MNNINLDQMLKDFDSIEDIMTVSDMINNIINLEIFGKNLFEKRKITDTENYINSIIKCFVLYLAYKKSIKKKLAILPVVSFDSKQYKTYAKAIQNNELLYLDKKIEKIKDKEFFKSIYEDQELNFDELYEIGGIYFPSSAEIMANLLEISSVLTTIEISEDLRQFIDEARDSFAFGKYNAVYALCRTILETALRDIGIKKGLIKKVRNSKQFYDEYPPYKIIEEISPQHLTIKIKGLYDRLSSLIHGFNTVDRKTSQKTLFETLKIVEELYDKSFS
jgi:hypothetical protein